MRISRIHTTQPLAGNSEVRLEGATAHYIGTVLRLGPGAELCLFNGDGHEYRAVLTRAEKKQCSVTIGECTSPVTESRLHTVLGLGISRGERMDYAVQKSTELGVNVIVPLFTEHCEVRLDAERQQKRQEHWQQIAVSACEQSGRVRVPEVQLPQQLATWVRSSPAALCLLLDQSQPRSLMQQRAPESVALLIGPEGGLSAAEMELALSCGFTGIALGKRTLRTETAPVAALSVLQYLWGEREAD